MDTLKSKNISCYECDNEKCNVTDTKTLPICQSSFSCYQSYYNSSSGSSIISRGCIKDGYDYLSKTCSNESGVDYDYNVICCKQPLCNDGTFSISPTSQTNVLLVGFIVLLVIVGILVIFGIVRCYQKEISDTYNYINRHFGTVYPPPDQRPIQMMGDGERNVTVAATPRRTYLVHIAEFLHAFRGRGNRQAEAV